MRGVLGWGVLIVIGIAALVEIGANSATLGTTNSALLRVPAWACVVFGAPLCCQESHRVRSDPLAIATSGLPP